MSTGRMPAVLGRRACAALAAGSAALHAAMLGHSGNLLAGAVLATMIVGCLFCARDLWSRGTLGAWCAVALMNLAMIAVHAPMPGHHHGAGVGPLPAQSALMNLTVCLALVEVVIAAAVLTVRTRNRSVLNPSVLNPSGLNPSVGEPAPDLTTVSRQHPQRSGLDTAARFA